VIDLLRDYRDDELVKRRLSAAQHWREHGLVFPSRVGTPRKGSNLWLSWKRLLKRAGLPDYKFHELRHTAASLALAEGASPSAVVYSAVSPLERVCAESHLCTPPLPGDASASELAVGSLAVSDLGGTSHKFRVATINGYHKRRDTLARPDFEIE
jgi:hypothetical protein